MSARDRRALVLGGLVLGVAVFGFRVAPWAWQHVHLAHAGLVARAELLARLQGEIASAPGLEDSGAVIRGELATLAPSLLTGSTGAEAVADLGARIAAAAGRHGARVNRTEPIPDSVIAGGLRRAGIRVTLECDTRSLLRLLQTVAKERTVVVVQEFRTTLAEPDVQDRRPEVLRSEVTVYGWYLYAMTKP